MKKIKPVYIVILCWLLYLVVDSLKKNGLFSMGSFFWYQYLPGLLIWMLITLPTLSLFRKTTGLPIVNRILMVLLLGVVVGSLKNLGAWLVFFVQGVATDKYPGTIESLGIFLGRLQSFYFMEAIIIAFVMLIVFYILELNKNYKQKSLEASQLESQLAKAQLDALKMQLQPHFLFNAHNTVSMLIRTQQYEQATEMISKISDLLRNSLKSSEGQFGSLKEEMELLKAYLDIEQVRFEDHLKISFDLDPQANEIQIPHLLLQPLVENAFKHGISKSIDQSELSIKTDLRSNEVLLSVYNTGPAVHEKPDYGIGLTNTIERLKRLYGKENYHFDIFNLNGGVMAEIRLLRRNGQV